MRKKVRNNLYILKLWFFPCVFFLFFGFAALVQVRRGVYNNIISVGAVIFFTSAFVWYVRIQAIRELEHVLKKDDVSELIKYYESKLKKLPNSRYMIAGASSLAVAFYGETQRARDIIDSISWNDQSPLLKAQAMQSFAFISYIEGEINEGLEFATAAIEESRLSTLAPGQKMSGLAFNNCKNLGIVLLGKENDKTVTELYEGFKKLPLLGKIVSAWGLSIALYRLNKHNESNKMKNFILSKTPNFQPIIRNIEMAQQRREADTVGMNLV